MAKLRKGHRAPLQQLNFNQKKGSICLERHWANSPALTHDAQCDCCLVICVSSSYKRFNLRTFFTNLHISAWGRLPLRPQAERCLPWRVVGGSARIKVPSIRVSRGSQHFGFNPVVLRAMCRIGHVFAQVFNQLHQCVPATLRCERPSTRTTRNRGHSVYVKGWVKGHLVAKSFTAITQGILLLCTVTAALCSGTESFALCRKKNPID